MANRIVKQPNGKYARFSDIVDDFTHYDMDEAEAVFECGKSMCAFDAIQKVIRANKHPERFEKELETIRIVHGQRRANLRRKQMS